MNQPAKHPRHHAFTLIEAVIVIAILGTLAAVAVPRFASAQLRYKADVAAKRIAADLALARNQAIAASADRQVVFDTANQQYQLTGIDDPDNPAATYTVTLDGQDLDATLTSADFNSTTTVTFDGFGRPTAGGNVVITRGGFAKQINVNPETGRITIGAVNQDPSEIDAAQTAEDIIIEGTIDPGGYITK